MAGSERTPKTGQTIQGVGARLKALYEQIARHTANLCAQGCDSKSLTRCCSPTYCREATAKAKANGIILAPASDPIAPGVPYLGRAGCAVPPWLRPICSRYQCRRVLGIGAIPVGGEPIPEPKVPREWLDEYDRIRHEIEVIESRARK